MLLAAGRRIGPYEIGALLGAGGMGEVYRARDTRLDRDVALKLIPHRHDATFDAVDRFRREAQAASALNHPNVVTLYEIGEIAEGRFIVMELVIGRTLRQLHGELPADAVPRIGVQVARALAVAHAAGIVHRDIKPENIMLRPDGYVKVLDFGLARLIDDVVAAPAAETRARTEWHSLLGTLRYMSPEQARGEHVGSGADVFALGLVLYELSTGRHPFESESSLGTLHGIASASCQSPASLNPAISDAFDRVMMRMLDRDPRHRPSADDVVAELGDLERGVAPARPIAGGELERKSVGRDRERAELWAAFERAAAGRGGMISVAGEPGIGKTTLVEDFLMELAGRSARCWIARGRCSQRLAGTEAYLPILEALDGLLRAEHTDSFTRLVKSMAPTWYEYLFPASGTRDSVERRVRVRAASPERFKWELGTLLQEMSRQLPIVLFLDDVHWADTSTVDLLSYLAARFDSMRILIVAAFRPADLLLADHPFAALRLELQARGLCREVAVSLLEQRDVDSYLALQFSEHEFPQDFSTLIFRKTEGNPLFMVDVLRELSARGIIARRAERWALVESVPAIEQDIPESIRSLIQRIIGRIDEDASRVLTVASVQGYEFDAAVLARVLGRDPADIEEQLDRLEHVHELIRSVGEKELPDGTLTPAYRFVHVLYQDALYGQLRTTRRASLSADVARAILSFYGEKPSSIAAQLALLFEVARDPSRAVEFLLVATQNAMKLFADEEAMVLARRGLRLLDKLPSTAAHDKSRLQLQLLLGAAITARKGFADSEAEQIYAQARTLAHRAGETAEIFPALHGSYRYFFNRADLQAACETVDRMVELAAALNDPTLMLIAEGGYGAPLVQLGDFTGALRHLEASLRFYEPDKYKAHPQLEIYGADPRMTIMIWQAKALWHIGRPDTAVERATESLTLARSLGHPFTLAYALVLTAWLHTYRREFTDVARYADEAIALSQEQGFGLWLVGATFFKGWALAQSGHAPEAVQVLKATLDLYRGGGGRLNAPHFAALAADACAIAGDADEALRFVVEGLEMARTTGERCWEPDLHRMHGELLLEDGRRDGEGEESLHRAVTAADGLGARVLKLRALCSLARLYQRQNRMEMIRGKLREAYSSFTEGFETPDLRDARALLGE